MRLYLVRHGKAEVRAPGAPDEHRDLRKRGERQAAWMGDRLAAASGPDRPALILTSPILRARRTAEIIRDVVGVDLRVEPCLATDGDVDDILALLAELAAGGLDGAPVLVGHNPQLEELLNSLVRGLDGDRGEMRTGQAALVDVAPGGRAALVAKLRLDDGEDD